VFLFFDLFYCGFIFAETGENVKAGLRDVDKYLPYSPPAIPALGVASLTKTLKFAGDEQPSAYEKRQSKLIPRSMPVLDVVPHGFS